MDDHDFEDKFLFYKFCSPSSRFWRVDLNALLQAVVPPDPDGPAGGGGGFNVADREATPMVAVPVSAAAATAGTAGGAGKQAPAAAAPAPAVTAMAAAAQKPRTFQSCFVGSEAVDWMVLNVAEVYSSRDGAILLGRRLSRGGYIRHVDGLRPGPYDFMDDSNLLYRFTPEAMHCVALVNKMRQLQSKTQAAAAVRDLAQKGGKPPAASPPPGGV